MFSLDQRPAHAALRANCKYRKKFLSGSLLTETAHEWYNAIVVAATNWDKLQEGFLNRFFDSRDQFKHSIDEENAVRQNIELIEIYLYKIKSSIGYGKAEQYQALRNWYFEGAFYFQVHKQTNTEWCLKNQKTNKNERKVSFELITKKPNNK